MTIYIQLMSNKNKISNLASIFEPKKEDNTQTKTFPKKPENGKVENNINKINNSIQNNQKEKQTNSQNGFNQKEDKTNLNNFRTVESKEKDNSCKGEINNSITNKIQIKKEDYNKFPKDFDDYCKKIKSIKHPLKDCKKLETIKLGQTKLNVYKYSAKNISLNNNENTITILFVGQSGAGKSTLINAYVNFLLGVYLDQPIRYKIVIGNKEKEKDQTKSQTDDITIYNIQSPLYPGLTFKLIDTPGVADTRNKQTESKTEKNSMDKINFGKFENFFNTTFTEKENGLINGISFVVKSSDNRVTDFQKLIISSLLNLFGKNAGENFLCFFSHADTNTPDAINVMTNEITEFKIKEEQKKEWYWCISSIKYFADPIDRINKGFFDNNIEKFISFTNEIINLPAIDMTLTKKNLALKNSLNILKKTIKEEYLSILLKEYNLLKESDKKLQEQIEKCNQKQNELNAKEAAIQKQIDNQNKIQNSINSLQKEIKDNENRITNCKNDIDKFQNDLSSLNSEINTLEQENKKDEEEKKKFDEEKEEARKKLNRIQSQISELKNNNNFNINIEDLKKQLEEQNNLINNIDAKITNLNKRKSEIDNKIKFSKNQKKLLSNKIETSKKEMNSIKDEKKKKETEQQNIINNYNELNKDVRRNSSVDILNEYLSQLEESKKAKKTITETKIESKVVDTDKNTLRCSYCEKNCHVNCDCKWLLIFTLHRSWWCNYIKEDHCQVCDCHYDKHIRENKWYIHETIETTKKVGLTDKEIQDIDNTIKEVREKIEKEKELEEKINEHDKNINQYEEEIRNKENLISQIDAKTKENEADSLVVVQNIEDEKKKEEALRKSLAETKTIYELKSNTNKLKENETKFEEKKVKIEQNKEKKVELQSKQKDKEKQISNKNNEICEANVLIKTKNKDMKEEMKKKKEIEKEVQKLKKDKDKLLDTIKKTFDKEKNRLQKEKDKVDSAIKKKEDEAIKQIIKMKIIMDEIKKIEIKSDITQTFENQLNEILKDNEDFIKNSESFKPLREKIDEVLRDNEEAILKKYKINKNDLISKNSQKKK